MSSQKTTNYDLNQWLPADAVLRTDFNADNAKIDAALQAMADTAAGKADAGDLSALSDTVAGQAAQIAQKGNCKIVTGTYTGTGATGSANPTALSFDGKPLLVFVFTGGGSNMLLLGRPCTQGFWACSDGFRYNTAAWSETGVSWYHTYTDEQMNSSGRSYSYIALLA